MSQPAIFVTTSQCLKINPVVEITGNYLWSVFKKKKNMQHLSMLAVRLLFKNEDKRSNIEKVVLFDSYRWH